LAEALRHAPPADLLPPTADLVAGYDLLCGLRRRQEWTALSTVVADHVIEVLRRSHPLVVADVPADLDGRAESGSLDLESATPSPGRRCPSPRLSSWSAGGRRPVSIDSSERSST
jgi:hypothetical protein